MKKLIYILLLGIAVFTAKPAIALTCTKIGVEVPAAKLNVVGLVPS